MIKLEKFKPNRFGRSGENLAVTIGADVSAWVAEYPSGTGTLVYKRPDGQTYPLTATLDGGLLCAVLTATDTAVSGVARVEAQWLDGAVVVKSCAYEGVVAPSLGEAGETPISTPSWVDDMTALGVAVADDKATVAADKSAAAGSADDAQAAQIAAAQSATNAAGSAAAAQASAAQIVTAESARVTAEQGRASAEQGRVAAESARVDAETQRGAALTAHTGDTNNPHSVTAAQLGAVSYDADQTLTDAQQKKARKNIAASYVIPRAGAGDGRNLKEIFSSAADLHAAISAGDFSDIQIGDYWPISLTGTYRDVGAYTFPAGTTLYSDTALTIAAGTAATALEAQWIDATYCKVSSGGDKYCATSDCLAYYERTLSNAVIKLEVAAINPYWRYGDFGELTGAKPHVLFVSRDCLPHYLRFRKANTKWHVAPDPAGGIGVWQGSALFATLNDPDNGVLPLVAATDIGAYIYNGPQNLGMRYYGETRAAETTTTSDSAWLNRGKLFLPTEDEVWGREIFTIRSYQGHLHLPLFHGTRRHISKGIGDGGSLNNWWSMSAYAGSASFICFVNSAGIPNYHSAVNANGAPV